MVWCVATAVAENDRGVRSVVPAVAGSLALCGAALAARARRPGLSFTLGAAGIVGVIATLFTGLCTAGDGFSTDLANSLTTGNAASSHYSLTVITIVAGCLLPVVLAYQSWSYWVFRHRVSRMASSRPETRSRRSGSGPKSEGNPLTRSGDHRFG